MSISLIMCSIIAILTTVLITPRLIILFRKIDLVGIDQQKKGKPVIPTSHGVAVALGALAGILFYVAIVTFATMISVDMLTIFAAAVTIETIAIVGFFDDIFIGKKKTKDRTGTKEYRIGIRQYKKALMVLPAAIPLMVINAGYSSFQIPFLGPIEFGILYPLLLVPIGVLCVSNATNMLAGINGMEALMSAIALFGLGSFAFITGAGEAAVIAFTGAAAFAAVLAYAWYPSKILPGDSATYLAGAMIATVVIMGNMEKFGIIIFIPWIIEAFVKAKNKFAGTSLGKLTKGGYLKPMNGRVESLTHVVMNMGNFKEWQISLIFGFIELLFVLFAFGLYWIGII